MNKQLSKTVVNTVKQNKGAGLIALGSIALGALAVFGYKRLPKEKKDAIKEKLNEAGQKVKNTYSELEAKVKNQSETIEQNAQEEFKTVTA